MSFLYIQHDTSQIAISRVFPRGHRPPNVSIVSQKQLSRRPNPTRLKPRERKAPRRARRESSRNGRGKVDVGLSLRNRGRDRGCKPDLGVARTNRNGRLHCPPDWHIGATTPWLTSGTTGTCCAYYSADTATPYSPSGLPRSAAAAADETAIAVAASSAITPHLLTYRGIKKYRSERWPSPPTLLVARRDLASSSWPRAGRGAGAEREKRGKGESDEDSLRGSSVAPAHPGVRVESRSTILHTCARRPATRYDATLAPSAKARVAGTSRNGTRNGTELGPQREKTIDAARVDRACLTARYSPEKGRADFRTRKSIGPLFLSLERKTKGTVWFTLLFRQLCPGQRQRKSWLRHVARSDMADGARPSDWPPRNNHLLKRNNHLLITKKKRSYCPLLKP